MANIQKIRQAVLLIHGIGEQHPIVTLRGFVESLASQFKKDSNADPDDVVFWDKPDLDSGSYETRKMTMRGGRDHCTTDFYEFYWAHHMRDTGFRHIKDWLFRVILRWPTNVAKRLLSVYFFFWGIIILLASAGIIYSIFYGFDDLTEKLVGATTGLLATVFIGYLSNVLFNYLGDAARYLDPSPWNVGERQAIRTEGMALLRKLHERDKYDRIIIVSHSLGTTIAYDLVGHSAKREH